MSFAHLVCHSFYSFMRGTASPEALVRTAAEKGMKHLAITDRNGLYGAVLFWEVAREHGIKPVIGADVTSDNERAIIWDSRNDFPHETIEKLTAWEQLAQALLCSNEFLFID